MRLRRLRPQRSRPPRPPRRSPPRPTIRCRPPDVFTGSTLSGYVLDARTRKPLHKALVETSPPTVAATTNLQGHFVLPVGAALGRLTVRATHAGFEQLVPVCVSLAPGLNTLADVLMLKEGPAAADDTCIPECAAGTTCRSGLCVSACAPLCACTEVCGPGGTCDPDPLVPVDADCGPNAKALGGSVCLCESGFVPAPSGHGCVAAAPPAVCPEGAARTSSGCECLNGTIPSPTGDACVHPSAARIISPIAGATLVRTLEVPFRAPRALGYDGSRLWMADADTGVLATVAWHEGEDPEPTPILALGRVLAGRLIDLAFVADTAWLLLAAPGAEGGPVLARFAPGDAEPFTVGDVEPGTFGLAARGDVLLALGRRGLVELDQTTAYATGQRLPIAPDIQVHSSGFKMAYGLPRLLPAAEALKFLAFTGNQVLTWAGTVHDGRGLAAEIRVFSEADPDEAPQTATLTLPTGATHLAGLEASGRTLWILVGGAGADGTRLEEYRLD